MVNHVCFPFLSAIPQSWIHSTISSFTPIPLHIVQGYQMEMCLSGTWISIPWPQLGFQSFSVIFLSFYWLIFLLIVLACYLAKTYFWRSSCQQVILVPFYGEDLGNWIWTFHLSPIMSNGLIPLTFSFCSCYRGREIPPFSLLNFITYIF